MYNILKEAYLTFTATNDTDLACLINPKHSRVKMIQTGLA